MLTQFGATVRISATSAEELRECKQQSTIQTYSAYHKKHFDRPLYRVNGDYLFFPRFVGASLNYKMRMPRPPALEFKQQGALKSHQEAVVARIMEGPFAPDSVARGTAGTILKLDMGAGKSFIAMELIGRVKLKTLIVCHVSNMIDQWRQNLESWFEAPRIGVMSGAQKTDGDIVIGLIQTLSKDTVAGMPCYKYFEQFGFVIFDEAHLYCSEKYSRIFHSCNMRYALGLSGTPQNKDMSHQIIELCIGPVLDADEFYQAQKFEAEVQIMQFQAEEKYMSVLERASGEVDFPSTLNLILSNPRRLELVVSAVIEVAADRNVFVFADRRAYLTAIQDRVRANAPELSMHIVAGGSSDADLERAIREARIIGTTYQYMSTGRSIPKMNALVLATPRKEKIAQTLGRIFRSGSSDETRRIVDVVDWGTLLMSQYRTRRELYKERGFQIRKVNN